MRAVGGATVGGGLVGAAVAVAGRDGNLAVGSAVLALALVAGVGQLAFAELLGLAVKLVADTADMADRLHAIDQVAQRVRRA